MTASFGFPVLSMIIFVPIIAGVLILFIPKEQKDLVRGIALMAAGIVLGLSLFVFLNYSAHVENLDGEQAAALQASGQNLQDYNLTAEQAAAGENPVTTTSGATTASTLFSRNLAFVEDVSWVPSLGISYTLGVDGLSAPMVLLTGLVAVAMLVVAMYGATIGAFELMQALPVAASGAGGH